MNILGHERIKSLSENSNMLISKVQFEKFQQFQTT